MHIEQCKAEVSQQESAMAAMKQYCHDRQQRLDTRDGEVKVMKTKLDHCLNEKDENKQQERSDSALTTTVEDLPEMHEDDIQTLSTVSRNVVGRFRRPLMLGEKYAKESRWQDVINSLKVAERILKVDTNNSIPERMVFQMFNCLWKAYRNLKDYQASINYCNEALSYQHKLFGPGCINKDVASCYHSCALAHELWGKLDDAVELYSTSVIYRRILCAINDRGGVSREKLGLSLRFLGRTYSKKGDMEASSKYLNMALEEEIKLHGQDETHPNIKKIRSLLDKTKHT
ncbi:uncharacterized protein LOC106163423 [Lingula anatina]|uniref:Uncharacterized protein LOC106163423 n=1 Tax=Lingula anatina TaxID=7574 RepID=A0A1S3IE75_LINAN|nr:uncharacterized protein LOC106163423 [Lingula anatina]|eukprot:XP_013396458.1 uncharacterized protein LOC106163423 [Lingula anatina]